MAKRGPKPQFEMVDLLTTAMEIVTKEGFSALSMSSLARHLGTSVSTLYRYVENREALFVLLQLRAMEIYQRGLKDHLDAVDVSSNRTRHTRKAKALAQVLAAFSYYLHFSESNPSAHRLLDAFLSAPEPLLDDARALEAGLGLAGIIEICTRVLKEAEEVGAIEKGDEEVRTHVAWAALHGLDHFRKRDRIQPDRLKVPALTRQLLSQLLRGSGASKEDVKNAWELVD